MAGATNGQAEPEPNGRSDTEKQRNRHVFEVAGVVLGVLTLGWPIYNHFQSSRDEVKGVVTQLGDALPTAKDGRHRLEAVEVEVNHCRLWPGVAATRVRAVQADSRGALRTVVAEIGQPSDPDAKRMLFDFKSAIVYSTKADEQYAAWLDALKPIYYDAKRNGCHLPTGSESYQRFLSDSTQATRFKELFVQVYNRLAGRYGEKSDWIAADI